jgi:hypothetical protein
VSIKKIIKKVEIEFINPMLGTVPKDPEIYKTFIETKKPETEKDEEHTSVEKIEEKGWTGFHKDDKGYFIYNYMIKGFLKNAANNLKEQLGKKALKSKINNFVFIEPRKIYFGKKEVDGVLERPLRAQTAQGPRVTLARSDYMNEETRIKFNIIILDHPEIKESLIDTLLEYGKLMGLGQFRNGEYGSFKLVEPEVQKPKKKVSESKSQSKSKAGKKKK